MPARAAAGLGIGTFPDVMPPRGSLVFTLGRIGGAEKTMTSCRAYSCKSPGLARAADRGEWHERIC